MQRSEQSKIGWNFELNFAEFNSEFNYSNSNGKLVRWLSVGET